MDYTFTEAPSGADDGWMGHSVKLFVHQDRIQELRDFLANYCGDEDTDWRIANKDRWIWGDEPYVVSFRLKKHAALLKLQWEEDPNPMEAIWESMRRMTQSLSSLNLSSQRMGRALRTVKPLSNPIPWYGEPDPLYDLYVSGILSRQTLTKRLVTDSIIDMDEKSNVPDDFWKTEALPSKDQEITIQVAKGRTNGNGSQQAKLYVDFETFRVRDTPISAPKPESGSGDDSPDV